MTRTCARLDGLVLVECLLATGCARSPEAQKARHWSAATSTRPSSSTEKRSSSTGTSCAATRPMPARCGDRPGVLQARRARAGVPFLHKAQEIAPDDVEVRLKLGTIYFLARQGREGAAGGRRRFSIATRGISTRSSLLADVASTRDGSGCAAFRRLETVRAESGDQARIELTLGGLYLRKQDPTSAERAFARGRDAGPEVGGGAFRARHLLSDRREPWRRRSESSRRRPTSRRSARRPG